MILENVTEEVFSEAIHLFEVYNGKVIKKNGSELRFNLKENRYILKATEGYSGVLFTLGELLSRSGKSIGMPSFNFISDGKLLGAKNEQPSVALAPFLDNYFNKLSKMK